LDEWEEKERLREKDDREKQKDMADLKRRLDLQEEIERELENAARNYSSQVTSPERSLPSSYVSRLRRACCA
jgi:hypothetical protein